MTFLDLTFMSIVVSKTVIFFGEKNGFRFQPKLHYFFMVFQS